MNKFNTKNRLKPVTELAFQNGLILTKMASRDVTVSTIVLGLLGDFIQGISMKN